MNRKAEAERRAFAFGACAITALILFTYAALPVGNAAAATSHKSMTTVIGHATPSRKAPAHVASPSGIRSVLRDHSPGAPAPRSATKVARTVHRSGSGHRSLSNTTAKPIRYRL